jgi:hypothetical protein
MNGDDHTLLLTRIADAVECLVTIAKQSAVVDEGRRTRRKGKVEAPAAATTSETASMIGGVPVPPVDIDNDEAMRAHAGERIRQLVARASEVGCPMADIEEVITDNTGAADPASLDLTVLSQIIVGLTRLIKGHDAPAEESQADKQIRAAALEQIRVLTQRAAATDEGLAATIAIMRNHAGGDDDVDHLELGKLQALLAAMQATAGSAQASAA